MKTGQDVGEWCLGLRWQGGLGMDQGCFPCWLEAVQFLSWFQGKVGKHFRVSGGVSDPIELCFLEAA